MAQLAEMKRKAEKISAAIREASGERFDTMLGLVAQLDKQIAVTKKELEQEQRNSHRPTVDTADVAELIRQLETMPAERRDTIRRRLRMAIANVVTAITLRIHCKDSRSGMKIGECDVELADGTARRFFVRVAMHRPAYSFSDIIKWNAKAEPTPMKFINHVLDLKTPEEVRDAFIQLYPHDVEMKLVEAPRKTAKAKAPKAKKKAA